VDVVVIAQTAARTATFQELRLALAQLLLRAQLQRQQDEHA
jgi:RNase P protein component